MKVKYLKEDQYYLIRNTAVACNSIFLSKEIQLHFKNKMEYYLSPICDISAYNLSGNVFEVILKLKDRKYFDELLVEKYGIDRLKQSYPESTYIFSQQMSNLQVSLVKKVNHLFKLSGGLMSGRFERILLETPEAVLSEVNRLNSGKSEKRYFGIWKNKMASEVKSENSGKIYKRWRNDEEVGDGVVNLTIVNDLVGPVISCPAESEISILKYHDDRFFNAIREYLS